MGPLHIHGNDSGKFILSSYSVKKFYHLYHSAICCNYMNLGRVVPKHAFGINTRIKNCIAIAEDHQLVYVCGHQMVVMHTETKEQSFIPGTTQAYQSLGISAFACSAGKKTIAVAEIVAPVAAVALYDSQTLRRRKVLLYADLGSTEIRSLAFSHDGRLCLTQGAGPEWNLVLWNVEKSVKVLGCVKISMSDDTPVNQVSFCPWDSNVILVIGKSLIRIFRVAEGQLRPVSVNVRREHANFISHAWLWNDKLLLGTEAGEILLLEGLEYRACIYPVGGAGSDTTDLSPILSLSPVTKGFVAGTTAGEIWSFTTEEDTKEQYKKDSTFSLPKHEGGIVSICVTADDALICAVDTQQLFHFNLTSSQVAKENGSVSGFENLFTGFHACGPSGEAAINGIDVALWKPIIVTCAKDNTVRVWNTYERRVEITKHFPEEPCALSVHPSGLYVVIAFADKIRIASILLDDIVITKEFNIRACTEIKFANGGHYFAAANGANVQIFNTMSGAVVSTLRGHTAKVRTIVWLNLDSKLMTIGQEGTVYFWDAFTGTRGRDGHIGVMPVMAGTGLRDGCKAYTISNERQLKEIPMKKTFDANTGQEIMSKVAKDLPIDSFVAVMAMDDINKIVFAGSADPIGPGSVISVMTVPTLAQSYEIFPLHSGPITAMCVTKDGCMLITGDMNGVLIVSEIEGSRSSQSKLREGGIVSFDFIEEILIRKSDLDARRLKANELLMRVEELTLNNDHQIRLKEREHREKKEEITERFSTQLRSESESYESYMREKHEAEGEFKQQLSELDERHEHELDNVENRYKAKLAVETARYQQLSAEIGDSHKKWNAENTALVESHQAYLSRLVEEYESKLNEEHQAQRDLQNGKKSVQMECDANRGNIEADGDHEIDDMKTKFENRLKQEEETSIALMADHAVMKKNLTMLMKDSDSHRDDIKRMREKEVRLIETIRSLEKDIQSHKKEIREREETITDKEKRIFDLKKKNQELEKFRFVLDYKIKELKLQIAPRENEITIMQRQIEDMDLELEQYHKSNLALNLMIGELKLKLDGLRKEYLSQTGRVDVNSKLLERFMRDLQEVWAVRNDYGTLKANVVQLYRVYVHEDMVAAESGAKGDAEGPQRQYNRDREQMERSLDALRKSLRTDTQLHKRELSKMMRENVMLTSELNDLRKEHKAMLTQADALKDALASNGRTSMSQIVEMLGMHGKPSSDTNPAKSQNQAALPARGDSPKHRRSVRSAAIRHSASGGGVTSHGAAATDELEYSRQFSAPRSDLREAWRELEMQMDTLQKLEGHLRGLCGDLHMSADDILQGIKSAIEELAY